MPGAGLRAIESDGRDDRDKNNWRRSSRSPSWRANSASTARYSSSREIAAPDSALVRDDDQFVAALASAAATLRARSGKTFDLLRVAAVIDLLASASRRDREKQRARALVRRARSFLKAGDQFVRRDRGRAEFADHDRAGVIGDFRGFDRRRVAAKREGEERDRGVARAGNIEDLPRLGRNVMRLLPCARKASCPVRRA